jgi:diadenosine tetraphosphate (Ap4A) HIT family hydrolase
MSRKDLYGLLASTAIQRIPGVIPFIIFETDKTIAVKLPSQKTHFHYVIFPKKDIKNVGKLDVEDASYLTDAFLVARHIIEKEKLSRYVMFTNGPDDQEVTYLHFHLVDDMRQTE